MFHTLKRLSGKIMIGIWFTGILLMIYPVIVLAENFLPPISSDQLAEVDKVFVREFQLSGNTIFTDTDFAPLLISYTHREITAEELQTVKNRITLYYVNRGYVNSGALIPDQDIQDGIILIRIIEGTLTQFDVTGNKWLRDNYILNRIRLAVPRDQTPLNLNIIQDRLIMLKDDPPLEKCQCYAGTRIGIRNQ